MSKFSAKAQQTIQNTMREFAEGKLRNGSTGKKVTDRKQALAIGISKAHENNQQTPHKGED